MPTLGKSNNCELASRLSCRAENTSETTQIGSKRGDTNDQFTALATNPDLAYRQTGLLRQESAQERCRCRSHVREHQRVWLQSSGSRSQRRNRGGWAPQNQGGA